MELPADRFLNFVYRFFAMNLEEKERTQFDIKLNQPPAGAPRPAKSLNNTPWSQENETASLSQFAMAFKGA